MIYFFYEDNFADDNTLSAWGETVSKSIDTLESDGDVTIDWFTKNEMIINPDKFKAVIPDRNPVIHKHFVDFSSISRTLRNSNGWQLQLIYILATFLGQPQ